MYFCTTTFVFERGEKEPTWIHRVAVTNVSDHIKESDCNLKQDQTILIKWESVETVENILITSICIEMEKLPPVVYLVKL